MIIRPFKKIINQLAHFFLSCIRRRNPLRLSLWALLPGRGCCYRHYRSLTEEQRWWDESARIRAFFARSDARRHSTSGEAKGPADPECPSPIPLIMSYVPRLLPQYRDHHLRPDDAANDYELMPSTYRKWHRLVFPHEVRPANPRGRSSVKRAITTEFLCSLQSQPSLREAAKMIKYISTRDRKEIARIARLVSDETAAQKGFSPSPVYRNLWESWLQHKEPDLTIIFE